MTLWLESCYILARIHESGYSAVVVPLTFHMVNSIYWATGWNARYLNILALLYQCYFFCFF